MAFISCPECSRAVSDRAEFCPSCGYPFGDSPSDVKARRRAERRIARKFRRDQTKTRRRVIKLCVFAGLAAGAVVASKVFGDKPQDKQEGIIAPIKLKLI